jgi:hypothetical protein
MRNYYNSVNVNKPQGYLKIIFRTVVDVTNLSAMRMEASALIFSAANREASALW